MSKAALFSHKQEDCCPQCGGELIIRSGNHGPFQGCANYPQCHYLRALKSGNDGHMVKVLDGQFCPECHAVLVLRQGKYGMFVGCSDYPECSYIASTTKTDETCIACPQCQKGQLLQRKSRFGKIFYACDGYPACQFTLNNKPLAGVCTYCHYSLLLEKRLAGEVKIFCASKVCGKQIIKDGS